MNGRAVAFVLVAACSLWSCSSSSGGIRVLPDTGGAPEAGVLVASLTIKVPLHVAERSHFLSPSTKSAEIAIKGRPGCHDCSAPVTLDLGLLPTSKGCDYTSKGIKCTVRIKLKPGSYTGALTTYDGPPGCQSALTRCNVLSLNQRFPLTIAPGKVKVPQIVLTGVPHDVTYVDVDASAAIDRNPGSGEFGMVGPHAKGRVELYARDYDGNLILGPGAPSFAATTGGGFGATVSGNVLLLTAPAVMQPTKEVLTISAHSSGCSALGANCTLTGSLQFQPLIAVAESANNAVAIYTSHVVQRLPFATVQSGVTNPRAVAFDDAGHLFVANANATVTEYAPPYTSGPIATFTSGLKSPVALAAGSNGDLAIGDAFTDAVYVFAPTSTKAIAAIALSGVPTSVLFDAANGLWMASSGQVQRYPQPYTGTPNALLNGSNGISEPVSIAIDAAGTLTVADSTGGVVEAFQPPYSGGPSAQVSYSNPTQVLASGSLVTVCGRGDILLLDSGSLNTNVDIPISDGGTQICAMDASSYLYDIDGVYGDIGEFDPFDYNFYGDMVEGVSQPSALAVFPHN